MRLDKFLKVARLAKRRTAAKEALDAGRIEIDGRAVKPSHQVKPGDGLLIRYASRDLLVRVLAVPERSGPRVKPESLYEILSDVRTSDRSA
jgi:ribosomal 50S subunit-recycling heat shock protein